MTLALEHRVRAFVAQYTATDPDQLLLDTTLFGDLGVDGEDASELFEAFAREFNVDISGFDHSRYFGPEVGAFPLLHLVQLIRTHIMRHDPHAVAGVEPIAIRDLVERRADEVVVRR